MNKVLFGFTAGLLVGLLFAPAKGSETRENIARRGQDLKNKFNDLVDSITDKFDSLTSEVEDMAVEETPVDNSVFVAYDFGHWTCKEGRYTYGRPAQISLAKTRK